jgi:hypothetical protein
MTLLQLYLQEGVVVSAAFRDETGLTVSCGNRNQERGNPHHGGKWSVDDLLFYIASLRGSDAADLLWQEICWVIGKVTGGQQKQKSFHF